MYTSYDGQVLCFCKFKVWIFDIAGEENDTTNKFILTAQSETLTLRTARPPDPPSNLSIAASTCNALRLVWDPPVEHGVEIIGKVWQSEGCTNSSNLIL